MDPALNDEVGERVRHSREREMQRQSAPGMDLSYTPGFSYLILSQKRNGCGVKQKVQWWRLFPS